MDSYSIPTGAVSRFRTLTGGMSRLAVAFTLIFGTPLFVLAQTPGGGQEWLRSSSATGTRLQEAEGFLFAAPRIRIGMRAGFNFARAASGIFDLTTDQLTVDRSDFGGFTIAGDLAVRVAPQVDVVLSAAHATTSNRSEFREWEDQDGLPIQQRTMFSQTPLTVGARLYPLSRGRQIGRFAWVPARFMPYVGASVGAVHYLFKQNGSFVDFVDSGIFDATFTSNGWAVVKVVGGGADFTVNPRVTLNTDVRYQWASADLDQDFIDFADGIDLNGLQLSVGVHFRF